MRQFPKLSLLLSSLLLLFLPGCRIAKYKYHTNCNRVFITDKTFPFVLKKHNVVKFKATIDVLKNHLTGILVAKKTDSVSTHLIFVTELGMKMFDFEWKNNEMKSEFIFEPLNKPSLIKALQTNLKNMLLLDTYGKAATLYKNNDNNQSYELENIKYHFIIADSIKGVGSQAVFNNHKKSSLINYTYNTNTQSYSQIKCVQYGLVKIHIELNEIPKTND